MAELESRVERFLNRRVAYLDGLSVKIAPTGQVGAPDRLLLIPGAEPALVEVKTETGRLSPAQQYWHAEAERRGFPVHVVRGRVGVTNLIEELNVSERIAKAAGRLSAARRWKGSENAPDEDQARAELAEAKTERAILQNLADLSPEGRERMARLLDDGGDLL